MAGQAAGIPLKVLLIEDSIDDAELIMHELARGGYVPVWERVETGDEMKKLLEERQWDIVIADYMLPRFSAPEALTLYHESGLDIPFLIVSGSIGEALAVEALKAGAHDCIMKDNLGRLVPTVERELRDSSHRWWRRKVEEALKESEERYRSLMETAANAGVGIAVIQDIGCQAATIVFVNDRLPEMLGFAESEVLGMPILDLIAAEFHDTFMSYYMEKLSGKVSIDNIEIALSHKAGGMIPVDVVAGRTTFKTEPAVVAYVLDISERKNAEKRGRELKELKEIDLLRSQLIANVSHELRTPLTSIKGFVSTLLRTDVEWSEEEKRDFLSTIAEETERLSALINDTLDISRIEAGTLRLKRSYYTAADIIASVRTTLANLTCGHRMKVEIARGLPLLFIDRARIGQVLVNLVENAVKYSPAASIITIGVRGSRTAVTISVSDRGVGIPAQLYDKVFDRFFQAERIVSGKKSGTGLGLSICKGIVEAHGGSIRLESEPGRGSTFSFSIPVKMEEVHNDQDTGD